MGESFAAYPATVGMPRAVDRITREHVEAHLAGMRERDLSPATVAKHYRSLQQLFVWLVDEGEIPHSPMQRMKPPTVPEQPVPVLDDVALEALLGTCRGNTFENRRDMAMRRLLIDTGMRAGELCGLTIEDVDFDQQVAYVLGKGGRHRACPFGANSPVHSPASLGPAAGMSAGSLAAVGQMGTSGPGAERLSHGPRSSPSPASPAYL